MKNLSKLSNDQGELEQKIDEQHHQITILQKEKEELQNALEIARTEVHIIPCVAICGMCNLLDPMPNEKSWF